MNLHSFPNLLKYFGNTCMNTLISEDASTFEKFFIDLDSEDQARILVEINQLLASQSLPIEEFGQEANRWFEDESEAKEWMRSLEKVALSIAHSTEPVEMTVTKDSNGVLLLEGDSVTVIQDLKVKGGSSDLKRGTQIKKIHLIGDPENIECRVNGSVLVLKTKFLRKI